jgi:hypothetical protein
VTAWFDLSAANDRVAELRPLLMALRDDRDDVARSQARLQQHRDTGPEHRDELKGEQERLVVIVRRMEKAVRQIDAWGITLRDISTGLVDFPALASGRPIWLCWRLGEGDVAWWHELESGLSGRKPLIELE